MASLFSDEGVSSWLLAAMSIYPGIESKLRYALALGKEDIVRSHPGPFCQFLVSTKTAYGTHPNPHPAEELCPTS